MLIDVYSHSVKVRPESEFDKRLIMGFVKPLVQWDIDVVEGKSVFKVLKVFAFENPKERSLRFHINLLKDFARYLFDNCSEKQFAELNVTHHEFVLEKRFTNRFKVKSMFTPKPDQVPVIEHLLTREEPEYVTVGKTEVPLYDNNKVITLRTGGGKTFISKKVTSEENYRTFIMMRGGYLDRWIPDLDDTFVLKGDALQVVQGSNSLSAVMYNAIDKLNDKVQIYLVSTDTYVEYLGHYERNGTSEIFPIAPEDFFDKLDIGATIIDEGHQMPHRIMKFFSYLHVYKHTTLTATLDTMDAFMDKMLNILYPKTRRFSGPKVDPHILVVSYQYALANKKRLRYTGWKGSYNHTAFEQSLMQRKSKDLFNEYIDMVAKIIEQEYIKKDLAGTKALIFFATIDMCTRVTKILEKRFPNKKVVRYISKDKMSALDEGEIIVSTVLSAGTAVDIPNLLLSVMTTAIDSQQSNEQTVGRTRPVKDHPDVNPKFVYFTCTDIDKHMNYHRNKERFFTGKVKNHTIVHSGVTLGEKYEARDRRHPEQNAPMERIGNGPANEHWSNKYKRDTRRRRGFR